MKVLQLLILVIKKRLQGSRLHGSW